MNLSECLRSGRGRSLLFLLLFVLLALALTACSNPAKAKAEHLQRGQQYLKDKKYPEAELEFRNAIQLDDKLGDAHWGLAQAYEGQGKILPAISELETAVLKLDPKSFSDAKNYNDAATRLGNWYILAYQQNHQSNLKERAQKLVDEVLQRDPHNIEGYILQATIWYIDGKHAEALAKLKDAVALDPKRIESLMSLARYYVQERDLANAEATFQQAIAVNNNSVLAHTQYGIFQAQQGHHEQAEAEFRKAIAADPSDREPRRTLGGFFLATKQYDKAEATFKELADLDKDRPEGRAVLGDYYAVVARYDDAIKVYQEIVAQWPDYTQARYRLGEIMLQRGDTKGASEQAKAVLDKDKNDRTALQLRARIHLQQGEAKPAIDDLAQVLKQDPHDQQALYFMAQAQLDANQIEQSRSYAGDLLKYYPDYLPGKLLQAQISLRAGSNESNAGARAENMKSTVRSADELLEQIGRATPSQQVSPELLADLRAKAYTARGAANLKLGNIPAARADFTAARDAEPNAPASYVNLAAAALAENKQAEGEQLYERALQIDGANLDALGGLVNLYTAQKQFDRAHARIDQAINAQPSNAGLHFLKAQIFGIQHDAGGAEGELNRALELDPNNAAALTALASLYVNTNQPDRAIEKFRKIVVAQPDTDDATALTLIGMVEDQTNRRDEAVKDYKDALNRNPPADIWAIASNNLAWDYAEYNKGNLDEAIRLGQDVVRRYPDVSGYADTLGWVYYKKGLWGAAVEQLQKAMDQTKAVGGDSAVYHFHLGLALAKMSRKPEARQQLQLAVNMGTDKGLTNEQVEEAKQTLATL